VISGQCRAYYFALKLPLVAQASRLCESKLKIAAPVNAAEGGGTTF
jgi:hypothetical protein